MAIILNFNLNLFIILIIMEDDELKHDKEVSKQQRSNTMNLEN